MPALARLLCCAALLAGGALLGACGSSSPSPASGSSARAASSGLGGTTTAASGSPAASGCRKVPAPAPKHLGQLAPPKDKLDPAKRYLVTLSTNCGPIAIALDVRRAPRTTSSFAHLVKLGFYNGLTFHRVAAGYVIQGGDPNGDGTGGPGYTVVEPPPKSLRYTLGTVAMAKTEADPPGASGSQFFIVTARSTALPPQYALVGRVVDGMRAVQTIGRLSTDPPQDGAPTQPVVISQASLSVSG